MKPELIEKFFQVTPDGVTVRVSMPGRDIYFKTPGRRSTNFGEGVYYIEADAKESAEGHYIASEILIDCSTVTHLSRLADER